MWTNQSPLITYEGAALCEDCGVTLRHAPVEPMLPPRVGKVAGPWTWLIAGTNKANASRLRW
jgi:hypothetical protein